MPTGMVWSFGPAALPVTADVAESLPDWLRRGVAGLELWQLGGVLLLVFTALVLQRIAVYVTGNSLSRLLGRLNTRWVEQVVARADRPLGGIAMAATFWIGLPFLDFPDGVHRVGMFATRVLAAASLVWLGLRLADVLAAYLAEKADRTETKLDDQLVPLVRKTVKLFVVIVGGIFVLQNMDVDVGSLLAGLGLGGLAFALAAKDTVSNFFGSVVVFVDKPFQIGDWVVIGDVEGTIEEIGFRTTRIRTFYNSLITLPNMRLTDSAVDNLGARRYRRYTTKLGLTYDTPPEKVQAFCEGVRAVIQALPGMRRDFFLVEFNDFGPHALQVLLYCFMDTATWAEELRVRTHLNLEILRLAKELGVSFAFPTQTLYVSQVAGGVPAKAPATEELAEVVRAFGPGGRLARAQGIDLRVSYDAGITIPRGDEADADAGGR